MYTEASNKLAQPEHHATYGLVDRSYTNEDDNHEEYARHSATGGAAHYAGWLGMDRWQLRPATGAALCRCANRLPACCPCHPALYLRVALFQRTAGRPTAPRWLGLHWRRGDCNAGRPLLGPGRHCAEPVG